MGRQLKLTQFKDINIDDPFFDSLKASYNEFSDWFRKKLLEPVYIVLDDDVKLSGMVYLKDEDGIITDVTPPLPDRRWLKVGTMKIEGRGTKLGERVIKKIFDSAFNTGRNAIYVTVFDAHQSLIDLFSRYGFENYASKTTDNGTELVLVRFLNIVSGDIVKDYPIVNIADKTGWLLAIYPKYHSNLFPDSILTNESKEIIQDVSYTNTIHKIYIGGVPLTKIHQGDPVIIYRTNDGKGRAFYRSVATSVCIAQETKKKSDFRNADHFIDYARQHSIFTEDELRDRFVSNQRTYVLRMTYNAAFMRRTTRGRLLDEAGISEQPRWDLRRLDNAQLRRILAMGEVNERLIVY